MSTIKASDSQIQSLRSTYDLVALAERDTQLKRQGRYYIGPCPFCRTGIDRFTIKDTGDGHVWLCRKCGTGKYQDAIDYVMRRENISFMQAVQFMQDGSVQYSDQVVVDRKAQQAKRQQEIDERLAQFTTHEIWQALHRRMSDENRSWWRCSGVPDEWQDYLCLGYTPDKPYKVGEELYHSPAYTIPYFHYGKKIKNLQYRLVNPCDSNDKYRFEYGLSSTYYMVTPTLPIKDTVIVCEGAKKAIVTYLRTTYTNDENISVIAVPSKSDFCCLDTVLTHCARVYIVLDPDAGDRAYMLAQQIGKQARVIELPVKIDDAFLSGALTKKDWRVFLDTQAVKV